MKKSESCCICPDGGMVDTLVLEASAERRESSSLSWGTILKHIVPSFRFLSLG